MSEATDKAEPTLDPAAELAVLDPDVPVEVRDPDTGAPVTLTVREFRMREGLEAVALARDLIADLAALAPEGGGGTVADAPAFNDVLAAHPDAWIKLVALACGRDADWIARLRDGDAFKVGLAMGTANGPFFARRVVELIADRAARASRSRSPASSTSSSAPATDAATAT